MPGKCIRRGWMRAIGVGGRLCAFFAKIGNKTGQVKLGWFEGRRAMDSCSVQKPEGQDPETSSVVSLHLVQV